MKQVTVYEVSQAVRSVVGDYIDVIKMDPAMSGWAEVGDRGRDGWQVVRHALEVQRLRAPDGRDVYFAIGPELEALLIPVVENAALKKLRKEVGALEASNRRLALDMSDVKRRSENDRAHMLAIQEKRWNFLEANVITRVWRAIRRAV